MLARGNEGRSFDQLSFVPKKPVVQILPAINSRKAVVPEVFVDGEADCGVACIFECIGQIIGPLGLDDVVPATVKHPDWQLPPGEVIHLRIVGVTADRCDGSPSFWKGHGHVPGAMAAIAQTGEIDAVRIGAIATKHAIEDGDQVLLAKLPATRKALIAPCRRDPILCRIRIGGAHDWPRRTFFGAWRRRR